MSLGKKTGFSGSEQVTSVVIGTAGHIDHGKTTLVRTITGIDTDRLDEEKKRGISIELGFAFLNLPDERVAIIDVPGHERFVRQMIAGAAGIDLVLLVVAADEGIMPQTLEHLDICNLLGVGAGAVILTKTDLVDTEWLELVKEDIRGHLQGSFLQDARIVEFSAKDPRLRDQVIGAIGELVQGARAKEQLLGRQLDRPFKMSVDRVFTMRGFGTVLTGTTASGSISVGDVVSLLPTEVSTRVRGIQIHGESVDTVIAGARAAINLQGVDHNDVSRSEVLSEKDGLRATSSFVGTLHALGRLSKPIKNRAKVLVHVGTAQIQGTLVLLGTDTVEPGEKAYVQVRLDAPTAILPGEPYVVRGFEVLKQYGKTLGGGRALLPSPRPHRRKSLDAVALLKALEGGKATEMVEGLLTYYGPEGVQCDALFRTLPVGGSALKAALEKLGPTSVVAQGRLYPRDLLEEMKALALELVGEFHHQNPSRPGMSLEEARSRLEMKFKPPFVQVCFQELTQGGSLIRNGERIKVPGFEPVLNAKELECCAKVKALLLAGDLTPCRVQDMPEELDLGPERVKEALELLAESGDVIRVSKDLAYAAKHLETLKRALVGYLELHKTIDTAALKELTGASRKWTIPLGEYFDRVKLTIRVGDGRRLRES